MSHLCLHNAVYHVCFLRRGDLACWSLSAEKGGVLGPLNWRCVKSWSKDNLHDAASHWHLTFPYCFRRMYNISVKYQTCSSRACTKRAFRRWSQRIGSAPADHPAPSGFRAAQSGLAMPPSLDDFILMKASGLREMTEILTMSCPSESWEFLPFVYGIYMMDLCYPTIWEVQKAIVRIPLNQSV